MYIKIGLCGGEIYKGYVGICRSISEYVGTHVGFRVSKIWGPLGSLYKKHYIELRFMLGPLFVDSAVQTVFFVWVHSHVF